MPATTNIKQIKNETKSKQKIEQYLDGVSKDDITRYTNYWKTITPTNHQEFYQRFQFAYLSVHTTWNANVKAYVEIDAAKEPTNSDQLLKLITVSGVGLHSMRTKGMWKFKQEFWENPGSWYKGDESWSDYRDRIMAKCYGLGFAKTSFALELCYPNECEVTCLDTHMLQLYGVKTKTTPSASKYREIENHWVGLCKELKFPAFMVRNIYWDKVQERPDTKYWTYVFEKETAG